MSVRLFLFFSFLFVLLFLSLSLSLTLSLSLSLSLFPSLTFLSSSSSFLFFSPQYNKVVEMVKKAVEQGAVVLAGGEPHPDLAPTGLYYRPTVLSNITPGMDIVTEEVFGPVMLLIKFTDEKDVVQQANSTPFALGSSVFTTDYAKAERVTDGLVSGMTTINDFGIGYLIQSLPFGGFKESGWGRFNGVEGLREFSRIKSVVTDRFPLRTKAPSFVQYPIPDHAESVVKEAVRMIYAPTYAGKMRGLVHMLKVLITGKR
jgi:Aldehyde dehydrogenase family